MDKFLTDIWPAVWGEKKEEKKIKRKIKIQAELHLVYFLNEMMKLDVFCLEITLC